MDIETRTRQEVAHSLIDAATLVADMLDAEPVDEVQLRQHLVILMIQVLAFYYMMDTCE